MTCGQCATKTGFIFEHTTHYYYVFNTYLGYTARNYYLLYFIFHCLTENIFVSEKFPGGIFIELY